MKPSFYRRMRRRPVNSDFAAPKKDNQSDQQFFGETMHEPFFKPVTSGLQTDTVHCKEEKKEDQTVQRAAEKKEEEKVQKKDAATSASGTQAVAAGYIGSMNGKGTSMEAGVRSFYESKMGADFSHVKIHTDNEAAASAADINAKAYTVGNDIVFNEGQYNSNSTEGKKLMAHELAHVMQNNGGQTSAINRQTSTPVPATATVDPATQIATFSINSVNVVVEPDQTLARGTAVSFHGQSYTVNSTGALTVSYLRPRVVPTFTGTGRHRRVSSVTITFTLYIKTFYGRRASATDTSAYGRGTTAADVAAGNTSLGFHEGNHGQDYQNYVSQHPLPQIILAVPASIRDYNAAMRIFNQEMRAYSTAMSDHSHTNTDMVGTPEP